MTLKILSYGIKKTRLELEWPTITVPDALAKNKL